MYTDDQLIKGCIQHDRKYQKILLDKYAPYLMSIALRYHNDQQSAKDTLQETWIKAFNNFHQYNLGTNLKAWLTRILINTALSQLAKNKKIVAVEFIIDHEDKSYKSDSNLNYIDLINVVKQIRSPLKEVFMMNVLDGMTHKEIGEVLNIQASTSRAHLSNARKIIQNILSVVNIV